jgi:hypothetical protein
MSINDWQLTVSNRTHDGPMTDKDALVCSSGELEEGREMFN